MDRKQTTSLTPLKILPALGLLLTLVPACSGGSTGATDAGVGGTAAAGGPAPGSTPVSAAGLRIDLPAGWQQEQPNSSMRAAQAVIPGGGGPGQFAVYFFGPGGGGGVDANIDRWISQMELPPGTQPQRETFESGAFHITWIELSGTLKASRIGSFPETDQPGYRMLAAVVEGQGGPWFLRGVGPEQTMNEQHDAFLQMLKTASNG